ncbi:MAG TPA: hypothetical protein VFC78_10555 [Tepidisphaeraceae bacterium]|nr:hypothetical protein [Tepidisphaeraceae bacterium]
MRAFKWAGGVVLLALLLGAPGARAEENVKPEQIKKMYDDALVQLKAAQDRKAELAKQNEALAAKVAELSKQLAASQSQMQGMQRQIDDQAEKTFYLRSYYAAWQRFLHAHPDVTANWKFYLGHSALSIPRETPDLIDPAWMVDDKLAPG